MLGEPWWRPLFVLSVLGGPAWILLTWLGDLNVKCGGPSRPESLSEKIATTAIFAAWMALLVVSRARHRRRELQTLAVLAEEDDAAREGVRIDVLTEETPALRVATAPGSTDSTAAADSADGAPSHGEDASSEPARRGRRR